MDLGLSGKCALVLGASRGLGKATALSLLAEGATVIAAARNVGAIEGWKTDLPAEQAQRLISCALDLSDIVSVEALLISLATYPPIDILVNNGGGPPQSKAADVELATWKFHFDAMAAHLFYLAGRILPGMCARGWGRIVTIASSGVEQPIPNLAISNAIRASVAGWSKTLASEVADKGVTVNMVLPGRIHTDRVDALDQAAATRSNQSQDQIARESQKAIPAGRYGTPEEFAAVVTFLVSEKASYMTGTQVRVDGGLIRSIG